MADVHKHMALAVVLERLMTAGKPLTYIETHAGRGAYDLSSFESEKTAEAETGIKQLIKNIPHEHPYAKVISAIKKEGGKHMYPGSPYIARSILEKANCIYANHPQEFAALENTITGVNLHNKDGYETALKLSPPRERRGLVLIDPSYEIKTEYADAANFCLDLHAKWPEAVILLWYPILDAGNHETIHQILEGGWTQEIMFNNSPRIRGSGFDSC